MLQMKTFIFENYEKKFSFANKLIDRKILLFRIMDADNDFKLACFLYLFEHTYHI